jgi:hypothetical protein
MAATTQPVATIGLTTAELRNWFFDARGRGAMLRIDIARLNVDRAVDELWCHGPRPDQVLSVLTRRWVVIRNRPGRAAPYLPIGRDDQGRCLTMPIVPTDDPLTWRVITGWTCKPSEPEGLMSEHIRHEPPRGPFDGDEVERMGPDNWDWDDPLEGVVVGDPKLLFTLEFIADEAHLLDALAAPAHARGMSTEAFIKRVALDAVHALRA